VYAVGDIHGRLDLLQKLIAKIRDHAGSTRYELIFLGDYIDRGEASAGVVDYLLNAPELASVQRVFLKGNHEAALLDFLDDPGTGPSWSAHGGFETLISYGVRTSQLRSDEAVWESTAQDFRAKLPAAHLAFYQNLDLYVRRGDFLFVHAGVNPDKPLHDQTEADLLWIRDAFLGCSRQHECMIVHGHTPEPAPVRDKRRIGVDTGAYQTGVLTAVSISPDGIDFLSTP